MTIDNEKSRNQRIRDLFAQGGGSMTTKQLAGYCLAYGVWDDAERGEFEIKEAQKRVRDALKEVGRDGLPFAGQTARKGDDGGALWAQRPLWQFPDYELNCRDLVSQRDTLHQRALALADECEDRFGQRPQIGFPSGSGQQRTNAAD